MSIISHHTKGSIFDEPLLFDPSEAETLKTKAVLLHGLNRYFKARGMTKESAIEKFGISEDKAESLLKGRISQFSIDELVSFLEKCSVHVVLHPELIEA